jgi:hypothetical protein
MVWNISEVTSSCQKHGYLFYGRSRQIDILVFFILLSDIRVKKQTFSYIGLYIFVYMCLCLANKWQNIILDLNFGTSPHNLSCKYLRYRYTEEYLYWVSWDALKVKQSSPATHHGGVWGERRCSSYSFLTSTLDGGEWSALSPAALYHRGKSPRYPLDKRLGGPQSLSGRRGLKKNPLPLSGIEPRLSSPWSDTVLTELPRLPMRYTYKCEIHNWIEFVVIFSSMIISFMLLERD